ncbi:hypothetical protein Tco_1082228 [Tanacetum coccineum]|uniref:Uncharacterized protein n=1 Tax=Tanacetum coccineum TaxID=301880 RepID=A0ABQ5I1V4_9ASTR
MRSSHKLCPSFHSPICAILEMGKSFTYDSTPNFVDDSPNVFNPPSQPPTYSCTDMSKITEISQKRTRERMSDQEAKDLKAKAREIMPSLLQFIAQGNHMHHQPSSIVLNNSRTIFAINIDSYWKWMAMCSMRFRAVGQLIAGKLSKDRSLSKFSSSNNSFYIQQIAASLEDKMTIKMNKMLNEMKALVVTTPAPVKAVEEVCVTCGSNHNFNLCPLTRGGNDFPVFHDNINNFNQTAAVGKFSPKKHLQIWQVKHNDAGVEECAKFKFKDCRIIKMANVTIAKKKREAEEIAYHNVIDSRSRARTLHHEQVPEKIEDPGVSISYPCALQKSKGLTSDNFVKLAMELAPLNSLPSDSEDEVNGGKDMSKNHRNQSETNTERSCSVQEAKDSKPTARRNLLKPSTVNCKKPQSTKPSSNVLNNSRTIFAINIDSYWKWMAMCSMRFRAVGQLIEQVVNLDTYTPEPLQCRKILICYDDDDDEESSIPLRDIIISELPLCIAITPVLLTEEPFDSYISMEDKAISLTISATYEVEFAGELALIAPILPRIVEVDLDPKGDIYFIENLMYDNSFPRPPETLKDDSETVIDSNNDYSSSDDDSYEDIDYVDASPPDSELVSLEEVKDFHPKDREIKDDILREKLSKINLLIAKIKALNANPTPSSDFVLKEKNSVVPNIHADISLPDLECFYFKSKPDPGELTSIVDSGIRENVLSMTNVNLPFEDDQSPLFAYVDCSNFEASRARGKGYLRKGQKRQNRARERKERKRKAKSKPEVKKTESKSTRGSEFGKSVENQTQKPKLPKVGPPVPT